MGSPSRSFFPILYPITELACGFITTESRGPLVTVRFSSAQTSPANFFAWR